MRISFLEDVVDQLKLDDFVETIEDKDCARGASKIRYSRRVSGFLALQWVGGQLIGELACLFSHLEDLDTVEETEKDFVGAPEFEVIDFEEVLSFFVVQHVEIEDFIFLFKIWAQVLVERHRKNS